MQADLIFLIVWAIVGIIFATLIKVNEQNYLTIKDVVCIIITGFVCGGVTLLIWFIVSDIGGKVVWRKKDSN